MTGGYGISLMSPEVWRLFGWLEIFVLDTSPKTSIFGDLRVKADQLFCSGDMAGQLTCLKVKGIYHIRKAMCFLKVKVDHLTTLAPDTVSFIQVSTLLEATPNPHQSYSAYYISNFTEKQNENVLEIRRNSDFIGHR